MPLILNRLLYFLTDFKFYLLIFITASILSMAILLRKRTKLIIFILSTVNCLLITFILGEIYFRYIYDQSDGLGFLKVNQKWHQRHIVFNNYFRRDRQFNELKPAAEIRIAVMGDSISFGGGIENASDRFSNLLEQKLRADGLNVSVYNLGISGTGSEDQIKDFPNFKHLNFDLLVWQYFLNDVNPPNGGKGTEIIVTNRDKFTAPPAIKWLTTRSFFADWLYWRLSSKYNRIFTDLVAADLNAYQDQELLSRHQTVIKNFLAQAQKDHLPVILIMFPFLYQTPLTATADKIYDQMLKFFQNQSTSVVDLKTVLRPYQPTQLMASQFDSHPNELVHKLAAQALYEKVLAYLNHP